MIRKRKSLPPIFVLFIIFSSCSNNYQDKATEIQLFHLPERQITLTGIGITEINSIPLICPDSIFFFKCNKIVISKESILLQEEITHSILIFDKFGYFRHMVKHPILQKGNRLPIIRGDLEGISLISDDNREIIFFDENLIYKESNPFNPYMLQAAIISEQFFYTYFPQTFINHNRNFSISYHSKNEKISYLLEGEKSNSSFLQFFSIGFLNTELVFWEYNRGKIYHIDSLNEVQAKYILNLGKNPLNFDKVESREDLINESHQTLSITRLIESSKHIFFESVNHGIVEFILYEKKNNRAYRMMVSKDFKRPGMVDDINNQGVILPNGVDFDGNFFSFNNDSRGNLKASNFLYHKIIGDLKVFHYENN